MRVLVDASALVPMEVPRDQHVRRVRILLQQLVRADAQFATTNWTLYEALAVAARSSHVHARALFARASSMSEIVAVGASAESEALNRFLSWADKSASIVDHANLLVAVDEGCDAILSFDDDFAPLVQAAGLQLLR